MSCESFAHKNLLKVKKENYSKAICLLKVNKSRPQRDICWLTLLLNFISNSDVNLNMKLKMVIRGFKNFFRGLFRTLSTTYDRILLQKIAAPKPYNLLMYLIFMCVSPADRNPITAATKRKIPNNFLLYLLSFLPGIF